MYRGHAAATDVSKTQNVQIQVFVYFVFLCRIIIIIIIIIIVIIIIIIIIIYNNNNNNNYYYYYYYYCYYQNYSSSTLFFFTGTENVEAEIVQSLKSFQG